MKLEKEIMKQIGQRLSIFRLTGEVVWHLRIQSGQAQVGKYYIKLAESGTPDWFAMVRGKNNELLALFIEAKSDTGKLRTVQNDFISRFMGKKDVYILIIRDIRDLEKWIEKYAKCFVNSLPKDL